LRLRLQPVGSEWLSALTSNHLENWNANANQQIIYQVAALLSICGPCRFHPSNPVELAIDAK
jgi:hypothetical protein